MVTIPCSLLARAIDEGQKHPCMEVRSRYIYNVDKKAKLFFRESQRRDKEYDDNFVGHDHKQTLNSIYYFFFFYKPTLKCNQAYPNKGLKLARLFTSSISWYDYDLSLLYIPYLRL